MHIFYSIIIVVVLSVEAYIVARFLLCASDAAKAITRDHNGYVDDIEMALTQSEHERTELEAQLTETRDWIRNYTTHVSEKVQAERLAEREAKAVTKAAEHDALADDCSHEMEGREYAMGDPDII